MRTESQFTASVLRRIHAFLERTPITVAMGDLTPLIEQLDAVVDELSAHGCDGESRRRASIAATGRIHTLAREARFEHMRPVARAARLFFQHDPAVLSSLQVRRNLRRPESVIDALRGMADNALPYKAELRQAGFADDFVLRMHALADALRSAIDVRARELGKRAAASVGTVEAAHYGRALLRLIDAMVQPRLAATPTLLVEWKSLLRQGRLRKVVDGLAPDAPDVPRLPSGSTPLRAAA